MNIWLEGLYQEKIKENETKGKVSEDENKTEESVGTKVNSTENQTSNLA